ncbi:MAG: hypothetical protein U0Y82_09440 [Thermoleophilia bacterium]
MRRSIALLAGALLGGALALTACGDAPRRPAARDWSPRPAAVDGLRTLAQSDAAGFRVHTGSGDETFLSGVNLGSTLPLHQPGEVNLLDAGHYRAWFAQMGRLGIRTVRIYTLHPPAFYRELAAYNTAHPTAPLYLVQGVYLPDESYNQPGRSLYTPAIDRAFTRELRDLSAAVHGHLVRPRTPGRAWGSYTTDVSPWLVSWIVGVEWDPTGVLQTNRRNADAPAVHGTYFRSTADASPTERWIARHMELLAGLEAARGVSMPIAFANWPTADPLRHPQEPNPNEDLAGVDANHVLPTPRWPGGTFASFHAYPYYPDFLRYEPGLDVAVDGVTDRYAGYLLRLKRHYAAHMPLMVAEFGVPASLGMAHYGTNGRDQGGHNEREAMAMDASMLRMFRNLGLAGGMVFSWEDEWFKRTWNTMDHQDPERRQLWHDPLTNEQWFGLVATDPQPLPDASAEVSPAGGSFADVLVHADASWVYMDVAMRDALPRRLAVDADVVPGGRSTDVRILADTVTGQARLQVRAALDPIRLDTPQRPYRQGQSLPWHDYALITNRVYHVHGRTLPAEFQSVGELIRGDWDPTAKDGDSNATWQVDAAHRTVHLRIPWSMLGLADPSSRLALGEGTPARMVAVRGIGFTFDADGARTGLRFTWDPWNHTTYRERLKDGVQALADAFAAVSP